MIIIKELAVKDGYYYNVLHNGIIISKEVFYDEALEVADTVRKRNNSPVEIHYISGGRPDFEAELKAKRAMDAKGW